MYLNTFLLAFYVLSYSLRSLLCHYIQQKARRYSLGNFDTILSVYYIIEYRSTGGLRSVVKKNTLSTVITFNRKRTGVQWTVITTFIVRYAIFGVTPCTLFIWIALYWHIIVSFSGVMLSNRDQPSEIDRPTLSSVSIGMLHVAL